MKNRIIGILLITLLLSGLCACRNKDSAIPVNESTFLVNFHIVCNTDAFAIHFEYYLDGTPAGGGAIGNDISITGSYESGFSAKKTLTGGLALQTLETWQEFVLKSKA